MSQNKILDSIFQQFLDNKEATVSSEGLYVEGSRQDNILLKYNSERQGLTLMGNLGTNQINVCDKLVSIFSEQRERLLFSLDTHEKISDLLNKSLKDISVNYGLITSHGVQSFMTQTDDNGELSSLKIVYELGSTVSINISGPPLR
jgi:hypothetical protein